MQSLTAQTILQIWERGAPQHPLDRALTILAVALPHLNRQALAQLPIGQRDDYLLSLYEHTFGPHIMGQAHCVACQTQVEFAFDTTDIRVTPSLAADEAACQVVTEAGATLCFRLPNSFDLAAIVSQSDPRSARRMLVERCWRPALEQSTARVVDALSEGTLALVAAQMAAADPQAEITLAVACPACGHEWQLLFDIVTFLWAKIETQARRLLGEVHSLAQAYGWREAEILALSTARRQFYLEMVNA